MFVSSLFFKFKHALESLLFHKIFKFTVLTKNEYICIFLMDPNQSIVRITIFCRGFLPQSTNVLPFFHRLIGISKFFIGVQVCAIETLQQTSDLFREYLAFVQQ